MPSKSDKVYTMSPALSEYGAQIITTDSKRDGAVIVDLQGEQKFKQYVSIKHEEVQIVKGGFSFNFNPFAKNSSAILEARSTDGKTYSLKLEVLDLPKISEFLDSSLFDTMVKEFLSDDAHNILTVTDSNLTIV